MPWGVELLIALLNYWTAFALLVTAIIVIGFLIWLGRKGPL